MYAMIHTYFALNLVHGFDINHLCEFGLWILKIIHSMNKTKCRISIGGTRILNCRWREGGKLEQDLNLGGGNGDKQKKNENVFMGGGVIEGQKQNLGSKCPHALHANAFSTPKSRPTHTHHLLCHVPFYCFIH